MTTLSPLIGELDARLELSEDKRQQRGQAEVQARHAVNDICDQLRSLAHDRSLWAEAACSAPALAEIQVRMRGLLANLSDALGRANNAAEACRLAEMELVSNSTILVARAAEGYLAYRPPEVAVATPLGARRVDIFAPPTTRVDMFNQALGEVQPPPGPPDINDGYGDPGVEDATGVVRARPLIRPDLVKDPTDSIQISDM